MPIERPDPPIIGRVTHTSIEIFWNHVKDKITDGKRYKFTLQELCENNKQEWGTVYSGFGVVKVIDGQKPTTEYSYRLMVIGPNNEKSEYSPSVTVKTTRELNIIKIIKIQSIISYL